MWLVAVLWSFVLMMGMGMPEACRDISQYSASVIGSGSSVLLSLVGIPSSRFAHDARSQKHKTISWFFLNHLWPE